MTPSLVWFRQDLRLTDNPALNAAVARGGQVIPVFIWAPEEDGAWPPGGASKWWLSQSLAALDSALRQKKSRLILRGGPSLEALKELVRETGAGAVFWNRRYEPAVRERDARIKAALREAGISIESFNAALFHEPWTIQNKSRKPFQVFTPFWRNCLSLPDPAEPIAPASRLTGPTNWPSGVDIASFGLEPVPDWAGGLRATWTPGEAGAKQRLAEFVAQSLNAYSEDRNIPSSPGTSMLSPYLHFGEISPRQIWHACLNAGGKKWRDSQFAAEVGWREFSHHLLYHFPQTADQPLRAEFENFRWRNNADWLKAWQCGRTGYPLVDAGMRQLWHTGWMHNRVRMIVASFLVKDLLIDWREGARWFWDTLVDADLAQNTLGWQWTSGCGADAAPYFRIFNPATQGTKFDPEGDYVRKWVPELAKLPARWIHAPEKAPAEILTAGGVRLEENYPRPIVSHVIAREVALEAYARIRKNAA